MKFKLDDNLPVSSARALTGRGHDVHTVTAEGLTGASDPDVVAAAAAAARVLITLDRGMDDIRAYPPGNHAEIVVLRLSRSVGTSRERGQGAGGSAPSSHHGQPVVRPAGQPIRG